MCKEQQFMSLFVKWAPLSWAVQSTRGSPQCPPIPIRRSRMEALCGDRG